MGFPSPTNQWPYKNRPLSRPVVCQKNPPGVKRKSQPGYRVAPASRGFNSASRRIGVTVIVRIRLKTLSGCAPVKVLGGTPKTTRETRVLHHSRVKWLPKPATSQVPTRVVRFANGGPTESDQFKPVQGGRGSRAVSQAPPKGGTPNGTIRR